jgi:hypothetical protein
VSSEETRQIAELLSKEDDALRLIQGACFEKYPRIFPIEKLVGNIEDDDEDLVCCGGEMLYNPFEAMFRRLYKYTESPIERALFGALCIRLCFGSRSYHIVVHKPTSNLEKYIQEFMAYIDNYTSAYASDAFVRCDEYPDEDDIWIGNRFRWGDQFLNDVVQEANNEYIDFVNAVHLVPQPVLSISGKSIRPDLAMWFPADDHVRLLIECDGYQFHSSKDKFRSDRTRDRELLELGYSVLRYSGSEIMGDPLLLAKRILDLLSTLSIPVRPSIYRSMVAKLNLLQSHSEGLPEDYREIAALSRAMAEACDQDSISHNIVEIGRARRDQVPEMVRPSLVLALERLDNDRLRELLGAVLFGRDYVPAQGPAPLRFLESIRVARRHPRDFCVLNLTRRPIAQFLERAAHYLLQSRPTAIV